jgi:hypothetical protein
MKVGHLSCLLIAACVADCMQQYCWLLPQLLLQAPLQVLEKTHDQPTRAVAAAAVGGLAAAVQAQVEPASVSPRHVSPLHSAYKKARVNKGTHTASQGQHQA